MTEQPDDTSPFRPVKLPPFPDSGLIPGATAEDVMGLVVTPPLLAHLELAEMAAQAWQAEENMWMYGTPTAPEPLVATKANYYLSISPELLEDHGWTDAIPGMMRITLGTATPEEIAANDARRAARDITRTAAVAEWQRIRERYDYSPAMLAVLDIHQPSRDGWPECQECEHADQLVSWPCSTYEAIRDAA